MTLSKPYFIFVPDYLNQIIIAFYIVEIQIN